MAITTLVHSIAKLLFYITLSVIIGRALGPSEQWFDYGTARRIGNLIYGPGEIGAENLYDVYSYIGIISVFSITTVIYLVTMKLITKLRSN